MIDRAPSISEKTKPDNANQETDTSWEELNSQYDEQKDIFNKCLQKCGEANLPDWDTDSLHALDIMLRHWQESYLLAENNKFTNTGDKWANIAERTGDDLSALFDPRRADLIYRVTSSGDPFGTPRTDVVAALFQNDKVANKQILTLYLAQRIEKLHELVYSGTFGPNEHFTEPYQEAKEKLPPLIQKGIVDAIKTGHTETVNKTLLVLLASESKDIARQVFLDTDLTLEELDKYALSYIEAFGYIPFIETLAPLTKDNPKIKKLFEDFSGLEVLEVMSGLDEVYDKAREDFLKHYEANVAQTEVGLVEKLVKRLTGKSLSEASILDLAAGFGRVSKALLDQKCGKVTSVEPHGKLFGDLEKLKETFGERSKPIQGSWENLMQLGISDIDLGICIGRSLPHANSFEKLLGALSQMMGTVNRWLIDYPDPTVGVYADLAERLEKKLIAKGVSPQKAKLIYDSPNGKIFFHRMIVGKTQLEQLGQLIGFTVEEILEETVGKDKAVKNVYYLIESIPDFKLNVHELMEITKELGLRNPGIDFNQYIPQWGRSLGIALSEANQRENIEQGYLTPPEKLEAQAPDNLPKVRATFHGNELFLEYARVKRDFLSRRLDMLLRKHLNPNPEDEEL